MKVKHITQYLSESCNNVPENIVESYSAGKCMYLATVINDMFDLPIRVQIETVGGEKVIAHAYNYFPDNNLEVDICGVQNEVDVFSSEEIRDFNNKNELWDFISQYHDVYTDINDDKKEELDKAKKVVNKYLKDDILYYLNNENKEP